MENFAIRFGDNDFGDTFENVVRLISEDFTNNLEKEQLLILINSLVLPCYLLYQNKFASNQFWLEKAQGYMERKITDIFMGDEITPFTAHGHWENGEVVFFDGKKIKIV